MHLRPIKTMAKRLALVHREAALAEGLAGDSTGFDGRWDGGALPRCACTEAKRD